MSFGKSREEVLDTIVKKLQRTTLITDLDPGTIAKAICDVMSEEFGDFYKELELTTTMGFVSTAKGSFLDMIGALLNCKRITINGTYESDANYRSRIVNQVYVIAGGNETAIRLKTLSVPGVQNVIMREHTKGTGSFSIYIITDELELPQTIISQVENVIRETKAAGIYAEVKTPVLIPIEVKVRLILSDNVSEAEKASIRQIAKQSIKNYIDNVALGGSFIINEIVRSGMGASNKVIDVDVYSLKINGMNQFVRNFQVNWDQRIVIAKLELI